MYGFQSPGVQTPPTFFRSFIGLNERKMKRFSNEQKRKKKRNVIET